MDFGNPRGWITNHLVRWVLAGYQQKQLPGRQRDGTLLLRNEMALQQLVLDREQWKLGYADSLYSLFENFTGNSDSILL